MLKVLLLADATADPQLAAGVRAHILGSAFGPSVVFQRNPHSLEVQVVDELIGNARTGKIADLVRQALSPAAIMTSGSWSRLRVPHFMIARIIAHCRLLVP